MKAKDYFQQSSRAEESLRMGILLAFAIGNLNACTYMTRGNVFASSQGGNILYMGLDLAQGDFSKFPKYLFCVIMFGLGVFLAEHFHTKYRKFGWRKISTMLEIGIIFIATLMPDRWNMIANPLFGLTCGLQSITFRRFNQVPLATIYINGNIQNAIENVTRWFHIHDEESFHKFVLYVAVITSYLAGIVIGALLAPWLDHWVSMISVFCLIIALLMMRPENFDHDHAHFYQKAQDINTKVSGSVKKQAGQISQILQDASGSLWKDNDEDGEEELENNPTGSDADDSLYMSHMIPSGKPAKVYDDDEIDARSKQIGLIDDDMIDDGDDYIQPDGTSKSQS